MRIISGKYKGRRLVHFQLDHIRPTTDRVKETIFNILQGYIADALVLDLYAGTGNLSIEALSRGAKQTETVEMDVRSIDIIKKNMQLLGIKNEMHVIKEDVLKYLKRYSGPAFDLILIDPPFTLSLAHPTMQALAASKVFSTETMIVIEAGQKEPLEKQYGALECIDRRDFGDKSVAFFKYAKVD